MTAFGYATSSRSGSFPRPLACARGAHEGRLYSGGGVEGGAEKKLMTAANYECSEEPCPTLDRA